RSISASTAGQSFIPFDIDPSTRQRVVGLVLIDRARLGRKAGDQAELLDRQWRGAELRVRREKLTELVEHRLAQSRQCDMRREFALLGLEADADQRLLDLVAQGDELGMALDPDPQLARLAAAEHAGAGKLQCEAARTQAHERLINVGGDALIDL